MQSDVILKFFEELFIVAMQNLAPVLVILAVIAGVYTIFQMNTAKFLYGSNQKFISLFWGGFSKTITFLLEKLPSLLILFAAITGLTLVVNLGAKFNEVYENQKRIKELTLFVKNLSQNNKVAHITVKEKGDTVGNEYGVYEISILDGVTGDIVSEKEYKIQGRDLRIDSMVINFEYSEIGSGQQKNLAFPYRVFSNVIPPKDAVLLDNFFTSSSQDLIIQNEEDAMLGLSREAFRRRAKEFIQIINNPVQRQEMGIRSSYGNTITIPISAKAGDEFGVYIEGTGGLSPQKI